MGLFGEPCQGARDSARDGTFFHLSLFVSWHPSPHIPYIRGMHRSGRGSERNGSLTGGGRWPIKTPFMGARPAKKGGPAWCHSEPKVRLGRGNIAFCVRRQSNSRCVSYQKAFSFCEKKNERTSGLCPSLFLPQQKLGQGRTERESFFSFLFFMHRLFSWAIVCIACLSFSLFFFVKLWPKKRLSPPSFIEAVF